MSIEFIISSSSFSDIFFGIFVLFVIFEPEKIPHTILMEFKFNNVFV